MGYKILHLIDTVEQVNFGIWNAALVNSSHLAKKDIVSYAAFPATMKFSYEEVVVLPFNSRKDFDTLVEREKLTKENTIIISHGCWRWATKTGFELKKKGYKWIAVPHGMLEPWSIKQKALKKKIYWHLIEKRLLSAADSIRAVGKPEHKNLIKQFPKQSILISNGIEESEFSSKEVTAKIRCLFMARLHHKKGIKPLIQGWLQSSLASSPSHELIIAGPDDGELQVIGPLIQNSMNIKYIGAVYDKEKDELLENSHVYLLPSFSEGFPTSVLEAMEKGLIPLISEGCNFPEAIENQVAIRIEPNKNSIAKALTKVEQLTSQEIIAKGSFAREFVVANYTNEKISEELDDLFTSVLNN